MTSSTVGVAIDPDQRRAASHRHMIDHLTGPFGSGAVDSSVEVDAAGRVVIAWRAHEPLLLVAPAASLADAHAHLDLVVRVVDELDRVVGEPDLLLDQVGLVIALLVAGLLYFLYSRSLR